MTTRHIIYTRKVTVPAEGDAWRCVLSAAPARRETVIRCFVLGWILAVLGVELFDVAVLAEGLDCCIFGIAKGFGVSACEAVPVGVD